MPGKTPSKSITAEPLTKVAFLYSLPSSKTVTLPVASSGKVTLTEPEVPLVGKLIFTSPTSKELFLGFTMNVVVLDLVMYNSSPGYVTIAV